MAAHSAIAVPHDRDVLKALFAFDLCDQRGNVLRMLRTGSIVVVAQVGLMALAPHWSVGQSTMEVDIPAAWRVGRISSKCGCK